MTKRQIKSEAALRATLAYNAAAKLTKLWPLRKRIGRLFLLLTTNQLRSISKDEEIKRW